MMVHDRHMSVYDKYTVLILVMATDVPGIRTLISGTCLLIMILPNSVPGCCCDCQWYMLAHPALLFFRLHQAGPPECGTFVTPECGTFVANAAHLFVADSYRKMPNFLPNSA